MTVTERIYMYIMIFPLGFTRRICCVLYNKKVSNYTLDKIANATLRILRYFRSFLLWANHTTCKKWKLDTSLTNTERFPENRFSSPNGKLGEQSLILWKSTSNEFILKVKIQVYSVPMKRITNWRGKNSENVDSDSNIQRVKFVLTVDFGWFVAF